MSRPRSIRPRRTLLLAYLAFAPVAAADPSDDYATLVRPLVAKYCLVCHSGPSAEADIDLKPFATLADVRKKTRVWQKVGEMLDGRQMPPTDAKQPTDDERAVLRNWVRGHLTTEAKAHAGDPGRVTLRRLSNAEYTYTLRDLTGVASLDPAREFPADGAAGEGFTNSGDALGMSPALVPKYLDAAKRVAAHAVLLPDGLRFSSHTTRQDWTNEILDRIRGLYRTYSDPGGSKVTLHGMVWDGKEGGRLPVEKYVAATLVERDALRAGRTTVAAVAADRKLSAKYLDAVWRMFEGRDPSPAFDDLREQWRTAGPHGPEEIAAEIARHQNALWKFNSVGHIGKLNGPKVWLEPIDPPAVGEKSDPYGKWTPADRAAFRDLFPTAVCYAKVVPVDEVVTLTLHYREDHHLARLMLTDDERRELDRLWDELHYVSRDSLAQLDAFKQLMEYATQDADPKVFEPLRGPIVAAAAAFRQRLTDTEPWHLEAVLRFAEQAYRRPLARAEADELTGLYRRLRGQELPHEESVRLTLARILVAPAFLYKLETPPPGPAAGPVSDWELASRLSYFLWSSAPDAELRSAAATGKLRDPAVLAAQMRRMLADDRVRRLATEFGCQWLHVRGFEATNEKSERHFPTFVGLRAAMSEESVHFFTDLFRADRSVSSILDADYTFLNERLANHYGIPGVVGDHWRKVDGVRKYGRGGILGLASTLASQSGASRTSPILRGNWVSEVLLGEKLPRPPKGVPPLPDDETETAGLTVRQLVARHTADAKCAVCHKRIDAYGFALEAFDPIGRRRETDLGGRPVDTRAKTADGAEFDGMDGLRDYLLTRRTDAFERQFCKKLLGYALGRAVQLSDEPLLDDVRAALAGNDGRVSAALEMIVLSRQFREIRGRGCPTDE